MDPSSPQNISEPNESISGLVNEFFDRRQAGEDLTPERFAAEHPEAAGELGPYLAGLALADRVCTSSGDALGGKAASPAAELPAIAGYELVEEIGRGGMGVVYTALQVSTKRIVALKVMRAGPFASRSARRRFEREVELAARLRHPNIVSVLEGGHVADRPYYAMDYVPGVELKRYLSTAQPGLRTTLSMFERICEAVDYAHQHGVIHRDLKPANVLVDGEGDPHMLDFGLAKATDQADMEDALTPQLAGRGLVLGTLFYLSPEQAVGAPGEIDVRTDVYALGVVLFEALTGSLPFDTTGRPAEVIQRMLETPPTLPSSLSKHVDGELETIILKALEKDKARRYQSAGEMADDIRRYLAGEPLHARQASGLYVFRKKLRKHRRLLAALGATVAAAVILVVVGLLAESRSRQRDLAEARRSALRIQLSLEGEDPSLSLGPARALFEQHPELPEAVLAQAQTQYRSEQHGWATGLLEDVLEDDPSRWACRALLAEFYRAAGDAERASGLQAQAERDAPDTAEAWYLRSFTTLDKQRALECAQEAVQREASHVLAWGRLSWLRLRTGDLDGALQGADKLIELGEDVRYWTLFKGQILGRQGDFRQAIREYAQLGPSGYVHQAHAYRRIKEYDKAVEYYDRVLESWGGESGAVWHFYQRAAPLWILGRTDEALADCRRVRILLGKPFYSDARAFLILHELGRQPEAEELLDVALRDVRDSFLRRIFRCLAGQLTPEKLTASPATKNNPEKRCEAYYYAGEACLLSGQLAEARQWFEQCVQTGVEFDPDTALGTPMNEYELAQWRLDTLFADKSPTSQP